MVERLKKELATKQQELDLLRRKLKDMEQSMQLKLAETDSLKEQLASLERINHKLTLEAERETDLRRKEDSSSALLQDVSHSLFLGSSSNSFDASSSCSSNIPQPQAFSDQVTVDVSD